MVILRFPFTGIVNVYHKSNHVLLFSQLEFVLLITEVDTLVSIFFILDVFTKIVSALVQLILSDVSKACILKVELPEYFSSFAYLNQ